MTNYLEIPSSGAFFSLYSVERPELASEAAEEDMARERNRTRETVLFGFSFVFFFFSNRKNNSRCKTT